MAKGWTPKEQARESAPPKLFDLDPAKAAAKPRRTLRQPVEAAYDEVMSSPPSPAPVEHSMPLHDRRFWVSIGIWSVLFATPFGYGLYALIAGEFVWGSILTPLGLGGLVFTGFYLSDQTDRAKISLACVAILTTWIAIGYQIWRAPFSPMVQGFTQEQVDQKIKEAVDPIQTQLMTAKERIHELEARAAPTPALRPMSQNDLGPIAWTTNGISFWTNGNLLGVLIRGKVGNAPVTLIDAYIISGETGEKKTLKVEMKPGPELDDIVNINTLPPDAPLNLWAVFPSPGLTPTEFIAKWGTFHFYAQYGETKYDAVFSKKLIEGEVAQQFPGSVGPHVTPKAQNK